MTTDGDSTRAIKAALRKAFPAAKFSITYGGSRIEWTDDGPTVGQVQDAIIAANCAEVELDWRGERRLQVRGDSIWFDRYNVAEREAYQADLERRAEERDRQRQRENEAVHVASEAREAALVRPPSNAPEPIRSAPEAFAAFEELQQRAERDVTSEDDVERQRRPA